MNKTRNDIAFLVDLADVKGMTWESGKFDANGYLTGAARSILRAKNQLTDSQKFAQQMSVRISDKMKTVLGDRAPSAEDILAYINELAKAD